MSINPQYIGYKFLKKRAPQIFFTGLFALILIAVPVFSLVFIWLQFSAPTVSGMTMRGYDLFAYAIAIIKGGSSYTGTLYYGNVITYALEHPAGIGANIVEYTLKYAPLGSLVFLTISAILAFVILIMAIKAMFVGHLKHFKGPTVFASLITLSSFFNALVVSAIFISYTVFLGTDHSYSFGLWWLNWVYFGAALVIRIVIACLYEYGIYDHIFVRDNFQMASIVETNTKQDVDETKALPAKPVNLAPDMEVEKIVKQEPVKVNERKDICLPKNITRIGGHEYAENTALTIAVIPQGITKIGVGAFANCINLTSVSIPKSVNEIQANCFFNCAKLKRINYDGTKKEWAVIKRGSNWLTKAGTQIVVCFDGAIIVNPYR